MNATPHNDSAEFHFTFVSHFIRSLLTPQTKKKIVQTALADKFF